MRLQRYHIISLLFVSTGLLLLTRLFFLQIRFEGYKDAAQQNMIRSAIIPPCRGVMRDRHEQLLTCHQPVFDIYVIPDAVKKSLDQRAFCKDFGLTPAAFEQKMQQARQYSTRKPSLLLKGISQEHWAHIQANFSAYLGFFVEARTIRQYPQAALAHVLGYVGEIGPKQLQQDIAGHYRIGDLVGIGGLEKHYEKELRGNRGMRYTVTNARGVVQGSFQAGKKDVAPTLGKDLTLTIDISLQKYGERLLQGKVGSIVAIEPATGEVLAMVSAPSYDPNQLSGNSFGKNLLRLSQDVSAPLFNRSIMGLYSPGSIFKIPQALMALQEGVITPHTQHICNQNLLKCRPHTARPNLWQAIQYSCNPYFYQVFRKLINQQMSPNPYEDTRLGLRKWQRYLLDWGLGAPLGVDLPGEQPGYLPDEKLYDARYGFQQWKTSTIRSLDIGQGELLTTPLQMANLAVTIANRGYYYTPHLVQSMADMPTSMPKQQVTSIDKQHYEVVVQAMRQVVTHGSGRRANLPTIAVCAKSGTIQNPHGEDHSACIAFAPQDNPTIALAVCIENAGWGARAAVATAGLMIEQYLNGTIRRSAMEQYVLKGQFFH